MLEKLFGGFFKEANMTEMEKLQSEETKLNGKITDLQAKRVRVSNALQLANVDLELDDTPTNNKRVKKYEDAISEIDNEVAELGEQVGKLQNRMSEIRKEERQIHIDSLAEQDGENYDSYNRARLAKELLEEAFKVADRRTGNGKIGHPANLVADANHKLRALGINVPQVDHFQPQHHEETPEYVAAFEKVTNRIDTEIDKDLKELQAAIEKYLGKKMA
ncbi:hypothetical protein ACT7C1_30755 [Bacillus paranthracis]